MELHLPHLRSLSGRTDPPQEAVEGLQLLEAPRLTHLALCGGAWSHQMRLGVMPQLQQLVLQRGMRLPSPEWQQQSPHLTSVRLSTYVTSAWLQHLPEQLQELDLSGCSVRPASLEVLVRLVSLRSLWLADVHSPTSTAPRSLHLSTGPYHSGCGWLPSPACRCWM
jgi:hypothetical protein